MIVLDTHIWFWYINESFEQFPLEWVEKIRQAEGVGVSSISCYKIVLAHSKGRLEINMDIQQWLIDALEPSGRELLPLTAEIAVRAVNLSPIHKDPFDRIIITTSLKYQAKLASIDGLLRQYPELKNYLM
ncbi:putative PilT protein, N-terminal [Crocosphaera subtropica ATCC 51142]|uniref:PilT protein, N-terminal n=1 Tax=Crocosphaera subtropica (strain ATCC 51142 / BH68) TaxID=43989 RepID=B1WZ62_CROS5|nr:PIN domain-containing protein [Crocosphaera subtropica]ACB49428.1 putative PilT protein, N-terminal [Crocosphaera subtropica ATCC 51142]